MITVGELFSGYGGMSLGLDQVIGETRVIWYADNARAPARIMARHHPFVPNLGDVTRRDWSTIPRVDILTGGTPCQDVSTSGKRVGMRAGTRSGLWATMTDAIEGLRPPVVIWENVRGVLSAVADSGLEFCPGCMGDNPTEPHLRALGRVLGDLSDIGYDAWWLGLPATAVGAPHKRGRVFVVATPTDARRVGRQISFRREHPTIDLVSGEGDPGRARLLHTPTSALGNLTGAQHPDDRRAGGHGPTLADDVLTHLTPGAGWGEYGPSITRWENVIGRPAPPPTEPNTKGGRALSPRFVEWLMGLPDGYVSDTPGISRADALACLGNGVVPQQLAAALNHYLDQVNP